VKHRADRIERFTREMEEIVRKSIIEIYTGEKPNTEDPDWEDPFFAAMDLPYDPKTGTPNPTYKTTDGSR